MPDINGKLSAEELREPPVTFNITPAQYQALPQAIKNELRYFIKPNGTYEVPAYRYREWLGLVE